MNDWIAQIAAVLPGENGDGEGCVLVTVVDVRGSAPRDPGARMIVTANAAHDTIGGGNLEAACVERARDMLATEGSANAQLVRYPLGPGFGQCCGGVATILFERVTQRSAAWLPALEAYVRAAEPCVVITVAEGQHGGAKLVAGRRTHSGTLGDARLDANALAEARALLVDDAEGPRARAPGLQSLTSREIGDSSAASTLAFIEPLRPSDFEIVLFGAGHVGRALVKALGDVDCRVIWVDTRAEEFPAVVPANTRVVVTDAPEREVDRASGSAYFLVMTHSHALDFELCERALRRGDFAYLGLIGSAPKRARFLKNLKIEGVPEAALARLTCPIGVPGITSKRPAAIALSAAAQILQVYESKAHEASIDARERVTGQDTGAGVRRRAKRS
jgi:xanthine dehydrogenase accessory factor